MIFILLFLFGLGGATSIHRMCSIRGAEIADRAIMNINLQHVIISTHAIAVHLSLLVNNSKMNNIIVIEKQI